MIRTGTEIRCIGSVRSVARRLRRRYGTKAAIIPARRNRYAYGSGRGPASMLQRRESAPERVPDQLRLIAEAELSHEIRAMAHDGADADRQSPGDLRAREALGRQQEDFPLPGGQF